jgi:asparagine synthase (glutamine-hydrolysing)
MCGLITIYGKKHDLDSDQATAHLLRTGQDMLKTLQRRGPDEFSLLKFGPALLGHTRLSIIDLHTGSQPIFNEDKSIAVLLNGEIYNYREIRADLEKSGHRFQSTSDTEVIVHLYEECGEEVFSKLNGMFAIIIYDSRLNTLLAARDRIGEKPIVYWESAETFVVASEIKALLQFPGVSRDIDTNALAIYLNSMYVPAPLTIFSDIKKLQPSHFIKIFNGKTSIHRYWNPVRAIKWDWKEDDIREQFLDIFEDSVKIRTYSDVPLGVFLSGGIDSSAVAAFMARNSAVPIQTFTVGFTQDIDERPFARIVAEKYRTDHTELLVSDRVVDVVDEVIGYFDEPFGDSSAIPTYLISREARKHVKVILTGDGGDELFAGYQAYLNQKYQTGNRIETKIFKTINQCFLGLFGFGPLESLYPKKTNNHLPFQHWHWVRTIFTDQELQEILLLRSEKSQKFFRDRHWLDLDGTDALTISYAFDMNFYLPDDLLKKVDMASMLCSLECRAPFLDYRLIDLSLKIPPNLKVKNDCLKYILKKSLDGLLPSEILNRRKTGFGAPVDAWLRNNLKSMVLDHLQHGSKIESFIDKEYIQSVMNDFYRKDSCDDFRIPSKLWLLFILEVWMKKYI